MSAWTFCRLLRPVGGVIRCSNSGSSTAGAYGDFIHDIDHSVGQLMEALRRRGQLENTIFIFTSDNGGDIPPKNKATPGKHQKIPPALQALEAGLHLNGKWRGDKHTIYEGGFRVPLIVSFPQQLTGGLRSATYVTTADFFATIAEMQGIKDLPETAVPDSFSFAHVARDPKDPSKRPHTVLRDVQGRQALRFGKWKMIDAKVPNNRDLSIELYDIEADPREAVNVAQKTSRSHRAGTKAVASHPRRGLQPQNRWVMKSVHRAAVIHLNRLTPLWFTVVLLTPLTALPAADAPARNLKVPHFMARTLIGTRKSATLLMTASLIFLPWPTQKNDRSSCTTANWFSTAPIRPVMINSILNPIPLLSGWLAAGLLAALAFVEPLHAQLVGFTMTGATTWSYDPADGGAVVTGILKLPSGGGPFPAVLISHGKGGTAGGFSLQHANVLAGWGLVCIGPNYTHAGAAVNTPDNEGYCPENSRRARACLAILQSLGTVDMARVAAFGHSMGSFLTGGLLGEIPASFRAACISAGGTAGLSDSGIASPSVDEVNGITAPMLMFHGTADTTVSPSQSLNLRNLLNARSIPNKRLLYQDIGHDIINAGVKQTDIHAIMRAWFTQYGVLAFVGNTAPTLTTLASTTVTSGLASVPLALTVGDGQTNAGELTVVAFTTDDARLPNTGLNLAGSGANRTLVITPAAGQTGSVEVALVVSDGQLSTVTYLQVTIQSSGSAAMNHHPDISWIADKRANPGAAIPPLAFTVTDAETAAAALTVTADSSNSTLLPVANISLTSGSSSRTATLTPVSGQSGRSTVTLTVNDGTKTRATSFTVTVAATVVGNTAPVIQGIVNETIIAGSTHGPMPLVIKDTETAEGNLTLSATVSNTTLMPVANIVFGGQNWGRSVTLTPAAGQAGRSVVTLSVSDATYTTSTSFVLDVVTGNTPPALTALPTTYTTTLGSTPQPLALAVNDAETAAADLRLTALSSNTTLVTTGNITFGGSGADRSITITPTPGQTGAATITLAVSDGDIVRTAQLLYIVTDPAGAAAQFSRPRGVFILDSANAANYTTSFGTTISLRDGNIRNLPFVDGFTLRAAWSDLESPTTPGSYDFFIIENALNKLPTGQRLSLIIVPGEPAYIATTPGVDTWPDDTTLRAKPWDSYLLTRRKALLTAMSQHPVSGVALGSHPRLDVINPYLPGGFTGIRDPNSTPLRNIAGYTRQKFLEAVQDELRALQDKFPGKFVQLGFWPITDNENAAYSGVTASEWLRQQLLAEFDGVIRPRVGFFMENLAAKRNGPAIDPYSSTPVISFASALDASKNTAWNSFQMLGSWVRPFNDGHVNNTLNGTPNDAMEAAFNTYRGEYHEVYSADIDTAALQPAFQRWHDFYASAATTDPNSDEDRDRLPLWWELAHGLLPTRNDDADGAQGDPDADGRNNLLEFALNLDPQANDPSGWPTATVTGNPPDLTYTYTRRTDAPWLGYKVEVSENLVVWKSGTAVTEQVGPPLPSGDGVSEKISIRILPIPDSGARFARLAISNSF